MPELDLAQRLGAVVTRAELGAQHPVSITPVDVRLEPDDGAARLEHDALMPTALGLAQEIAANPPLAVQRMKAGLRRALDPDWNELGAWVTASLGDLFRTADHREGVAAFLEKREPKFEGR